MELFATDLDRPGFLLETDTALGLHPESLAAQGSLLDPSPIVRVSTFYRTAQGSALAGHVSVMGKGVARPCEVIEKQGGKTRTQPPRGK